MENQTEIDAYLANTSAQSVNGHNYNVGSASRKRTMRTNLPQRWLKCPSMGKVVHGIFLPLKTPLDATYDGLISPKYRFYPRTPFDSKLEGAKPDARISLWVDLTNTHGATYYDKREIQDLHCTYKKLALRGHGETPLKEQVSSFIAIVKDHLKTHKNDVIAVHCTHGFNRTGYLIAAYLYQEVGLGIEEAVEAFAVCRPDGIYKQHYLDDLVQRYNDGDEDIALNSKGPPVWERDDFVPINNSSAMIEKSVKNGRIFPPIADPNDLPKFMDGKVPEVSLVQDAEQIMYLREKIRQYCNYPKSDFPGSQPVSLDQGNIQHLAELEYMVSWKADGLRYLILIEGKQKVYAFDRGNNVFNIPRLTFPRHPTDKGTTGIEHLKDTLLDAEMVIDHDTTKDGLVEEIPRLLIYDIISLQGNNVSNLRFPRRFELILKEVVQPRNNAFINGLCNKSNESIHVRRKDFYYISATDKIIGRNFGCAHEIDGLIFQPSMPYQSGRFKYLLKWKPPEHSTIDFRLEIKKIAFDKASIPRWVGLLYVLGEQQPFGRIFPVPMGLGPYNNKIVECRYNRIMESWEFVRERTDKNHPNAKSTADSVFQTIQHPVTREGLLKFIAEYGYGVKQARSAALHAQQKK